MNYLKIKIKNIFLILCAAFLFVIFVSRDAYAKNDISFVTFDLDSENSYCHNIDCKVDETGREVIFKFDFENEIPRTDDADVYLFEFSTYEKETFTKEKKPVGKSLKGKEVTINIPYKDRYLFSRFVPAIMVNGEYCKISEGVYISNPEILAENTEKNLEVDSKKGILLDANTIDTYDLFDLNVKRIAYNIPLSYIIGESENEDCPTIDYEYNGEVYHFNGYLCMGFDSLFSYLKGQGIRITAIILNDWNKKYPSIIHPKSRHRTGKSLYYAMNTEEEEGVRLMEATAKFLAERYSGGEFVYVYDWVIANEVNQQTIWNYMDTDDIDYYTESFEKSFRTFYNAIKSNYSKANVYFSIDHDWNDNYGNNSRFFNGRDFLYKFNDCASLHGNYDWNVSIHPYPDPLTKVRFWNGKFDKSENARVITPMNLSALTTVLEKDDFRTLNGKVRDVAVTELGFSSRNGEKLQAAAFSYSYYIIENNKYISSYLLNRQTDDRGSLKSGLALGVYNNDYSPKYIKDVFSAIDSKNGEKYLAETLEIIGADSLEEALSWAE